MNDRLLREMFWLSWCQRSRLFPQKGIEVFLAIIDFSQDSLIGEVLSRAVLGFGQFTVPDDGGRLIAEAEQCE